MVWFIISFILFKRFSASVGIEVTIPKKECFLSNKGIFSRINWANLILVIMSSLLTSLICMLVASVVIASFTVTSLSIAEQYRLSPITPDSKIFLNADVLETTFEYNSVKKLDIRTTGSNERDTVYIIEDSSKEPFITRYKFNCEKENIVMTVLFGSGAFLIQDKPTCIVFTVPEGAVDYINLPD